MAEQTDYEKDYDEFWKDVVENPDGTLNRDQIMRELFDYQRVMHEVSLAYDEVTGGRFSKPNTDHGWITSAVEERTQEAIDDALKAARAESAAESAPDSVQPRPVGMSLQELVDVLDDIRARVEAGDSFEGTITYSIPEDLDSGAQFDVRAVYRIGNSMGQGGMRMIQQMPEGPS